MQGLKYFPQELTQIFDTEDNMSKKLEMKVDGSKFLIMVDPNEDGDALIKLELDLAEVPDEVLDLFMKKEDA